MMAKLLRLETLTDLVEFAKRQMEKESIFTAGWCDSKQLSDWEDIIGRLRQELPKDVVKEFDDGRARKKHRDGCGCLWCKDQRGDP